MDGLSRLARMRKIRRARIRFVSLVPEGANRLTSVYHSRDTRLVETQARFASPNDAEKGLLTVCVYAPNRLDDFEFYATPDVVQQMAHDFQRNGGQIDLLHEEEALPQSEAWIAENFVIQPGDKRFTGIRDRQGKFVDVTGGWGQVIQLENPVFRELYRSGEWKAVSMSGQVWLGPEEDVSEPGSPARPAGNPAQEPKTPMSDPQNSMHAAGPVPDADSIVDNLLRKLGFRRNEPAPATTTVTAATSSAPTPAPTVTADAVRDMIRAELAALAKPAPAPTEPPAQTKSPAEIKLEADLKAVRDEKDRLEREKAELLKASAVPAPGQSAGNAPKETRFEIGCDIAKRAEKYVRRVTAASSSAY